MGLLKRVLGADEAVEGERSRSQCTMQQLCKGKQAYLDFLLIKLSETVCAYLLAARVCRCQRLHDARMHITRSRQATSDT